MNEHDLITSFILPGRQERCAQLLNSGKRKKFVKRIISGKDLNMSFARTILPNEKWPNEIARILKSLGAVPNCYVLSENSKIDGREMLLESALDEIVGFQMGTLLSCRPGRLAYYEGEGKNNRLILFRAAYVDAKTRKRI
jgi:hypothetical protein